MRLLGSFLSPRQKRDVDCFLNIVKYPIPVKLNSIISRKWLSNINNYIGQHPIVELYYMKVKIASENLVKW